MLEQLWDYRARLLDRLEEQPAEFARVIAEVPEAEWHTRLAPAGPSRHQSMAHVRDLEVLAFLPRIRRIVAEDQPRLDAYPSHHWADTFYRPEEPMAAILTAWSAAREELVQLLRPLPNDAWSRVGFHPPSGNRTLQWWAERAFVHARDHLEGLRAAPPPDGA
jgi:hypothetical protein